MSYILPPLASPNMVSPGPPLCAMRFTSVVYMWLTLYTTTQRGGHFKNTMAPKTKHEYPGLSYLGEHTDLPGIKNSRLHMFVGKCKRNFDVFFGWAGCLALEMEKPPPAAVTPVPGASGCQRLRPP